MELILNENGKVTSLEVVEQINFFRKQDGNKCELGHNDLLKVIRDEFEEEISLGNISQSTYKNSRGREYAMFELTIPQAKQILVRESKFVRKAVIKRLDELESMVNSIGERERLLLGLFSNDSMVVANSHKALVALETKPLLDKIEKDKPKVDVMDAVLESDKYFDCAELSKMLNVKSLGRSKL